MAEKDSQDQVTEAVKNLDVNDAETEKLINSPEPAQTEPENATSDLVEEKTEKVFESAVEQEPSIEANTSENCHSDNDNQETVEFGSTGNSDHLQESEEQGEETTGPRAENKEDHSDEPRAMGGKHPKSSTEEEENYDYQGEYRHRGKGHSGENTDQGNRQRSNENQGCRPKNRNKKPGIQRPYGGTGDERPTREKKNRKNNWNGDSGGEENDQKGSKGKSKEKNKGGRAWNKNSELPDEREQYEYFWKSHSVFSQWYMKDFEVDGIKYNCAEQYMMHQKAVLMKDHESAQIILALDEPREMKQRGRYVENFNQELWDKNCRNIVEKGNMAKFSQDKKSKDILFSTYPKTLVEASPMDKIWGIGLAKDDERAWNKQTWRGQNLLGEILTKVRDTLMDKEGTLKPVDPESVKEASENKREETSVSKEDSEVA
ncbi:uncharacterized protein LOC134242910 [Saccostrea cucullata]|uniref:uncharacterized protein LOC134242910 n=1 Tax=Saccostrea cuccullata TaxID=36930 RepID=UPI002ED597DB